MLKTNTILKSITTLLAISYYLLTTTYVHAQCAADEFETDLGCVPADPAGFTSRLYAIGLGFIGGAALLSIMYGGYLVMSSRGDRDKLMKGRSYIFSAIAGMVLAIIGFALYQIIAVDVIKLPGFS
jgi:hypothetical protein